MNDRKSPLAQARAARVPKIAPSEACVRISLRPEEAGMLREILSKDLLELEAEMAGNDWQDLSEPVLARESLLRRLLGGLRA